MTTRMGQVVISNEFLSNEQQMEILGHMFHEAEFVPICIDNTNLFRAKIYLGYSPRFRELEEGDEFPKYRFTLLENKRVHVEEV